MQYAANWTTITMPIFDVASIELKRSIWCAILMKPVLKLTSKNGTMKFCREKAQQDFESTRTMHAQQVSLLGESSTSSFRFLPQEHFLGYAWTYTAEVNKPFFVLPWIFKLHDERNQRKKRRRRSEEPPDARWIYKALTFSTNTDGGSHEKLCELSILWKGKTRA